jgi:hypothetical protein
MLKIKRAQARLLLDMDILFRTGHFKKSGNLYSGFPEIFEIN